MSNLPKPTKLKILNGNPGKRPLNENEPQPTGTPTCPSWLNAEAKREWKRVCPELSRLGLLTVVDRAALAGYCVAYSRWKRAEEEVNKGFSYQFVSNDFETKRGKKPEVQIAMDSLNQVKQFCAEFGLTPSSRARMVVPGAKESDDPIDKILNTKGKWQ
jgi:P27 family predicted phage terminase small subunit